jgi:hypothetical protein
VKPETQNPNPKDAPRKRLVSDFGLRFSDFFRSSDFGFRISYCSLLPWKNRCWAGELFVAGLLVNWCEPPIIVKVGELVVHATRSVEPKRVYRCQSTPVRLSWIVPFV